MTGATLRIVEGDDGDIIAAAVTDAGEVVATAAAYKIDGDASGSGVAAVYIDEVQVWEATGQLLPDIEIRHDDTPAQDS